MLKIQGFDAFEIDIFPIFIPTHTCMIRPNLSNEPPPPPQHPHPATTATSAATPATSAATHTTEGSPVSSGGGGQAQGPYSDSHCPSTKGRTPVNLVAAPALAP